ncbi:MAG: 4a-hydroxytetrahydrobiopterin dehydratase [Deltaproteobacteria bacterium]|nr:4a-hydroxytetrahydrobiopterin dehydratase [Deltaproteobacteria bacterium]
MPTRLSKKNCIPCKGGVPPLAGSDIQKLFEQLKTGPSTDATPSTSSGQAGSGQGWTVVGEHHLEKEYVFDDFRQALDFTVKVGEMAEQQGHHPDIHLAWGKAKIVIWTHKIDGLTESDFIFAAKADELL